VKEAVAAALLLDVPVGQPGLTAEGFNHLIEQLTRLPRRGLFGRGVRNHRCRSRIRRSGRRVALTQGAGARQQQHGESFVHRFLFMQIAMRR
jgi:hypothetical protein